MRMAIWPSLPYKKLITPPGEGNQDRSYVVNCTRSSPADTLFLPKLDLFFPPGFGHRLRFLLRLLGSRAINGSPKRMVAALRSYVIFLQGFGCFESSNLL